MSILRVTEAWQRAAVYWLRIEAFVKGQQIPLQSEFDSYDGEQTSYVLILDNQQPIATARLLPGNDGIARIGRVCVAEGYRNSGVGRKVIEAAEDWARELGIEKIVIISQTQAAGFYERLGYKVIPEIELESPIPVVHTEKKL